MKRRPKVFVTGATGYLGGHLLNALQQRKEEIIALTRKIPASAQCRAWRHVHWIEGDLLKPKTWKESLSGCTAVIHLATLSLADCDRDPMLGCKVIVRGSRLLFDAAREAAVSRFIQISTAEVYGSPSNGRISVDTPLEPLSVYGFLKACADLYVLTHGSEGDMSVCVLCFSNLYGPYIDGRLPSTVLMNLASRLLTGEPVILHGSVQNSRDFLHVEDAARAILLALDSMEAVGVINVGSGCETTLKEAARRLAKMMKMPLRIQVEPEEGRMRRAQVDLHKASKILGFCPKISFDRGLQEMLRGLPKEL